jgi:hypothetical protein
MGLVFAAASCSSPQTASVSGTVHVVDSNCPAQIEVSLYGRDPGWNPEPLATIEVPFQAAADCSGSATFSFEGVPYSPWYMAGVTDPASGEPRYCEDHDEVADRGDGEAIAKIDCFAEADSLPGLE